MALILCEVQRDTQSPHLTWSCPDKQADLSARRNISLPGRYREKQSYEIQELKAKSQAEVRVAGSAWILFALVILLAGRSVQATLSVTSTA